MIEALAALGSARTARTWLEAEIKRVEAPHREAAEQASAHLRPLLDTAKEAEEQANDAARALYSTLLRTRRETLLAGLEAPAITIPKGWAVQERSTVEIVEPERVPRSLCIPDKKAVADAIKAGEMIPGARSGSLIVFVHKEPKCTTSK